ncbi:MAG: hypothetical protein AAF333_01995 [Planctomycetota bacterium]
MSQEKLDLRRDYFVSLREEIKETKARIFRIIMLGLIGTPIMVYFSVAGTSHLLLLLAPLVVLLLVVLYLAEQNELMRAGRFIRQKVENDGDGDWEHWVASLNLRSAERQLFAMFVVIGLFVYVLLLMLALGELLKIEVSENNDWYRYYFEKYGVMLMYGVATLWALITLLRFWRGAVTTD